MSVTPIDLLFQGTRGIIASYLLDDSDGLTLIETGPSSTIPALLAGISAAGHEPEDITRLIVTHIHLDHAGAAGSLLRILPGARLLVSEFGVQHLIDPSRLVASATRIYGDAMQRLWGEIVPVPAERIDALHDGDTIRTGARTLRAMYTPGHASHHIALHDAERGVVFTGDVAGVRLRGAPYVCPPTPPPDIDLSLWRQSIIRLRASQASSLYLTHFGLVEDVPWHLDDLLARLHLWAGWTSGRLASERDTRIMADELRRMQGAELASLLGERDPVIAREIELATPTQMSVDGLARYLTKRPR